MIKKLLFATMAFVVAGTVMAQETTGVTEIIVEENTNKHQVVTNRFWNNCFISVAGGAQVFFGDHDNKMPFGDRIAPALDVSVGKWFTPGLGIRLMYSGLRVRGATQEGVHSKGKPISKREWDGYWLEEQQFNYYNLHGDVLFNFSNLFCGYNPERIWNCSPYVGIGWTRVTNSPHAQEVTANIGIFNSFRISKAFDINLDLRGTFVNDRFDGELGGRSGEGLVVVLAGVTYKFKQRGWDRCNKVVIIDNDAINEMRNKLNEMTALNAELEKALAAGNKVETNTIIQQIAAPSLIVFEIGKSELSMEARANLELLSEVIKKGDANAVYTVTGYADEGTGSKELNEELSKKRADAVYNYLVNDFKVSPSKLRVEYRGGVGNMFFNDPRLSRAVITRYE